VLHCSMGPFHIPTITRSTGLSNAWYSGSSSWRSERERLSLFGIERDPSDSDCSVKTRNRNTSIARPETAALIIIIGQLTMVVRLPQVLIQSILLLSLATAHDPLLDLQPSKHGQRSAETLVEHDSSLPSTSQIPASQIPTSQIPLVTLWDVGFCLQESWADLRDAMECPVVQNQVTDASEATSSAHTAQEDVSQGSEYHVVVEDTILPPNATFPTAPVIEPPALHNDDFVSFEEWKRLKLAEEGDFLDNDDSRVETAQRPELPTAEHGTLNESSNGSDQEATSNASHETADTSHAARNDQAIDISSNASTVESQPSARSALPLPFHNKYNYASPDCSARILSASPQTQHASSLLHKSRDRYMLTPCKSDQHWVVIELCDEIRISEIEVAVWEFFSGVVREIKLSVGGAEDEDEEDESEDRNSKWKEVGVFIGKNVRGAQVSASFRLLWQDPELARHSASLNQRLFIDSFGWTSPPTMAPSTTVRCLTSKYLA
jgi:hypothetical protein